MFELDADGKEISDGLMGKLGIIGISFLVGFFLPLVKGSIRNEIIDHGLDTLLGIMTGVGVVAAMIAALMTMTEHIKGSNKRALVQLAGVLLIVVLILTMFWIIADIMNWQ